MACVGHVSFTFSIINLAVVCPADIFRIVLSLVLPYATKGHSGTSLVRLGFYGPTVVALAGFH